MNVKMAGAIQACLLSIHLTACGPLAVRPDVLVREASPLVLPGVPPKGDPKLPGGEFDCNNPLHWNGGTVYVFSSTGHPWRASGPAGRKTTTTEVGSKRASRDSLATGRGDRRPASRWRSGSKGHA